MHNALPQATEHTDAALAPLEHARADLATPDEFRAKVLLHRTPISGLSSFADIDAPSPQAVATPPAFKTAPVLGAQQVHCIGSIACHSLCLQPWRIHA